MRIAVTGAGGFVGRHFVDHALAAGHEVVAIHRLRPDRSSPAVTLRRAKAIRYADLLEPDSLDPAVAGATCVCHLAAAFSEAHATDDYFQRVNVDGTVRVMRAAHAAGATRFVYCSTAGIYGKRVPGIVDETHRPQPWNAYEKSKVAAEAEVRRHASLLGMEYVILRPSQIYGPGDKRLSKLWRNAARGRFPLFGRGEGRRHMVYVGDLAEALLRACTYRKAANEEMIIAGPEAARLREILELLADLLDRPSTGPRLPLMPMVILAGVVEDACRILKVRAPLHRRRMDFYVSDAEFDCSHALEVLGWRPQVSLREGLRETLAAEPATAGLFEAAMQGSLWFTKMVAAGEAFRAAQALGVYL
jgi:nucleoside-diphosphate-sugar epimerase